MRYIKDRITFFLTVFSMFCVMLSGSVRAASPKEIWPDCPSVKTGSSIVMDIHTGTVLVGRNSTKKAYPASITKLMTAMLVIENCASLDEKVVFTKEAVRTGDDKSSSIGMIEGEELTVRECLYGLLLASANEVANALAIHTAGSREAFVELMNEKAASLGCVNTHFNNPSGLFDEEHYTCAEDMAKIARAAIKHEELKEIAGTRSHIIPKTELMDEERPVANTHQMVNPAKYPEYAYEYCYAGKTGYTKESGFSLVSYAKKSTMDVVCVIMNAQTRETEYTSTSKLLNYCFKRFRMEQADKVKLNLETESDCLYTKILKNDPGAAVTVSGAAMLAVPKKCDISSIKTDIVYKDLNVINKGINDIGTVSYKYKDRIIGNAELSYDSIKDYQIDGGEKAAEGDEKKEEGDETNGNTAETTWANRLFFGLIAGTRGRIILGVTGTVILLCVIYFVRIRLIRNRRRRGYLIHRKVRRGLNRGNRLKWK